MHGTFKWNALDNAEEYRALALRRRNEGAAGTVRLLTTAQANRLWDAAAEGWHGVVMRSRLGWQHARSDALETFVAAVFPERHGMMGEPVPTLEEMARATADRLAREADEIPF